MPEEPEELGAFATALFLGVFFRKYRRLGLTMRTKRALQITTCATLTLSLLILAACRKPATWSDPAAHKIGFVTCID